MEDRLHKLAQVVDSNGFSSAALAMHISQPALTTAIKKLERELGVTLLERGNKNITLTPAGLMAYQTAKQLLTDVSNLKQHIDTLAASKPTVRLGMIDSVADLLAKNDGGITRLKQQTDLSLTVDNSRQLTNAVVTQKLDAAIIVEGPTTLPDVVTSRLLGQEPLTLVTHPNQYDLYSQAIADGQLPNFLCYNTGSHSNQLITAALAERTIVAEPAFYSTSPEVMLKQVLLGQGATILPYSTVANDLAANRLTAIALGRRSIFRTIYAINLHGHELLPDIEQIFQLVTANLKQLQTVQL